MTTQDAPVRATFKSFAESTAEDWALINSHFHIVEAEVADHVLYLLRALDGDTLGFPVTRLEHSLQTATRAERAGEDDEYVLCALLHDIGDSLAPNNHPAIPAAILKGHVSEANHFMVANHAVFQGYYFWHHLGRDRNAREAFRDSPYFDRTAHFCEEYDQRAFDPDYPSNPLEHYEPLIRSFFAPKS